MIVKVMEFTLKIVNTGKKIRHKAGKKKRIVLFVFIFPV
jgi:hypothetical protein